MSNLEKVGSFKSFSVVALKNGGWKATLKFAAVDDGEEAKISFAYRPAAKAKNFTLSALGYEFKAKAVISGDKLLVDLKIPPVLAMLASVKVGTWLDPIIHLELDADMISVDDKSITFSTEIGDKPFELNARLEKQEETKDAWMLMSTVLTVTGFYGDHEFSATARTTNEYSVDQSTYDKVRQLVESE